MTGRRALTREEIKRIIDRAERLRDKAFIAFLYLSAARVGEVCRRLRKSDFTLEDDFLLVELETEKNPSSPTRVVALPLSDPFTRLVLRYLRTLNVDEVCWPFSDRYARMLLRQLGGIHPHLLRHSRLTHLVREHGFNQFDLMRFAGWSDPRPARAYIHLEWRDYAGKLKGPGVPGPLTEPGPEPKGGESRGEER